MWGSPLLWFFKGPIIKVLGMGRRYLMVMNLYDFKVRNFNIRCPGIIMVPI